MCDSVYVCFISTAVLSSSAYSLGILICVCEVVCLFKVHKRHYNSTEGDYIIYKVIHLLFLLILSKQKLKTNLQQNVVLRSL